MPTEQYKALKEQGNKLLLNIHKSYKRGFSEATTIQHANTLIELVNTYITGARDLQDRESKRQLDTEWTEIRQNLLTTFEQLKTEVDLPEELPTLPLQKLGSATREDNPFNGNQKTQRSKCK